MPARKRGRKRLRVYKNVRALKKARDKLARFLVDMEAAERGDGRRPRAALHRLGLTENGYRPEGRAITSLAWTACGRLDALQEISERMGGEG